MSKELLPFFSALFSFIALVVSGDAANLLI